MNAVEAAVEKYRARIAECARHRERCLNLAGRAVQEERAADAESFVRQAAVARQMADTIEWAMTVLADEVERAGPSTPATPAAGAGSLRSFTVHFYQDDTETPWTPETFKAWLATSFPDVEVVAGDVVENTLVRLHKYGQDYDAERQRLVSHAIRHLSDGDPPSSVAAMLRLAEVAVVWHDAYLSAREILMDEVGKAEAS